MLIFMMSDDGIWSAMARAQTPLREGGLARSFSRRRRRRWHLISVGFPFSQMLMLLMRCFLILLLSHSSTTQTASFTITSSLKDVAIFPPIHRQRMVLLRKGKSRYPWNRAGDGSFPRSTAVLTPSGMNHLNLFSNVEIETLAEIPIPLDLDDLSSDSKDVVTTTSGTTNELRRSNVEADNLDLSANVEEDNGRDSPAETHRVNLQIAALAEQCAQQRNVSAAVEALELLRTLPHPDTVGYNSAIKALAKVAPARIQSSEYDRLRAMARPDLDHLLENLGIIVKKINPQQPQSYSAALVAHSLLEEMKALYEEQWEANQQWYDGLEQGSLSDQEISQGPPRVRVKPNVRSYSTVMDAYSRTASVESAMQVQSLLDELLERCENWGHDRALEPNRITYNTVLTAWAKAGSRSGSNTGTNQGGPSPVVNVTEKCLAILESMPVEPDVISYNAVLHAMARSGDPQAGEMAERFLRNMPVPPTARSYTTCMDAWTQQGVAGESRPDRAHALLKEMWEEYRSTGRVEVQPTCISYATVIHAYAVSNDKDKVIQAQKLFREMTEEGIEPNSVIFNNMLNCAATCTAHAQLSMDLVKSLYQQVVRKQWADHYTFGTVLKACSYLLCKDAKFAPAVFRQACAQGQVSAGVLWQLKVAVPADMYRELVGGDENIEYGDLPAAWRRRVREGRDGGKNARRRGAPNKSANKMGGSR